MVLSIAAVLSALVLSFAVSSVDATAARGLGWATDNKFAPVIGSKPLVTWYHHWQDGPVSTMPSKNEYVPLFWGPSKWDLWNKRVAEMKKKTPAHLMAFNEPDVSSQSNMDPTYAAQLYMEQIYPWAKKGTKLGSPAIVFNLKWMTTFLNAVKSKGGHVDFLCIHWYGSWKDLAGFKKWVQSAHSAYGMDIWITEVGITSSSGPSQSQVKSFMMNAFTWLDTQSYVKRAAWFGSFEVNNPPDSFATGKNALFNSAGQLSDMGYWYGYTRNSKRDHSARRNILARNGTEDATDDDGTHCDTFCQLRNSEIEAYESTLATRTELDTAELD